MPSENMVQLATRVPKTLHSKLIAEQKRIKELTGGIEPSLNEVVNMLIEKGLKANGKRR